MENQTQIYPAATVEAPSPRDMAKSVANVVSADVVSSTNYHFGPFKPGKFQMDYP